MGIGATKAVQDRLKTTKIEESKSASLVFCWDTHLTKIKGRNVLFIVNASNRYTIAMTDIEPRNWNYYTMYIRSVIHGVMQEMGYSEEQIGQYFKKFTRISIRIKSLWLANISVQILTKFPLIFCFFLQLLTKILCIHHHSVNATNRFPTMIFFYSCIA